MMFKHALLFVVVIAVLVAGCNGPDQPANAEEPKQEEASSVQATTTDPVVPATAKTFVVRPADRSAILTAFTRARKTMTLTTEESGRVQSVRADIGDAIGSDGIFAQLDTTYIRLDLESNRADQQRLDSDVDYNKKEMDRYQKLVTTRTAAQSELDSNVRNHATALNQLRALKVQERILSERMRRYTLRAPRGWQVIERHIEPGEWITTGTAVAELGRYDVLLVPFALTVREYETLKDYGNSIPLQLTDLKKTVSARIAQVSPGFDAETRKIAVDLEIAEGDFEFRGGLRCELELGLPDPGGAVLVPSTALLRAYEEFFLFDVKGRRVKVVLLGSGPDGTRRVTSPSVKPGDTFLADVSVIQ